MGFVGCCNNNFTYRTPAFYLGGMNGTSNNKYRMRPQAVQCSYQSASSEQKTCKTECSPQNTQLVCASFGGIILTDSRAAEQSYELVVLNLNLKGYGDSFIDISFACNVALINTTAEIGFQLYRLGEHENIPLPVNSPVMYIKNTAVTIADSVFFHAWDCFCPKHECCTYIVKLRCIRGIEKDGMINVMNPVLTALI